VGGSGLIVGNFLLAWLDPSSCFDRRGDRVIVSTWIGVLVLANLYLAISLFAPLSPSVTIPATLLLLGASLWSQQVRCNLGVLLGLFTPSTLVGSLALILGVSAYCSQVVVWYDSGLYHVQIIKWLSEFGLVPGMAQIHSRLGFISSWFALPATFSQGFLQDRVTALPGALCLLLTLVQSLTAYLRIAGGRARTEDFFFLVATLLAVPVILVWGMPNSPTPDLPVIVLGLVVAWAMLAISCGEKSGDHSGRALGVELVPLLLAVGAGSIKLSAVPLVAVGGCFYLCTGRLCLRKIVVAGSLPALGLTPLGAAGIVTTGCAFYPSSFLCIDAPWSLGAAFAKQEFINNRNWLRWGGLAPDQATGWNWFLPWVKTEMLATAMVLLSFFAVIWIVASRVSEIRRGIIYIVALGISGITFMLYSSPSWRFGVCYLVVLPALVVAIKAKTFHMLNIPDKIMRLPKNFGLIATVTAVVIGGHAHVLPRPSYQLLDHAVASKLVVSEDSPHFNPLLPPKLWRLGYEADVETGKMHVIENVIVLDHTSDIVYYRPENPYMIDQCWDAPLPCSIVKLKNIKLRQPTKGIAGGFEKIDNGPPLR
jgi:hypothetical protein